MLTCKQATGLISRAQDCRLTLYERLLLRTHLMMRSGCINFRRQLIFIRKVFRRIGGDTGAPARDYGVSGDRSTASEQRDGSAHRVRRR